MAWFLGQSVAKHTVTLVVLLFCFRCFTLLALDSGHKETNTPALGSPLVDEESMRPGCGQCFQFSFNTLTLLVGSWEEHPA